MLDSVNLTTGGGDATEVFAEGSEAAGEFHCTDCGYGVTVHTRLPRCPMCSGTVWEQVAWSPFSRARDT